MAGIAYQWIANPAMPITLMFRQLKEDLVARLGRVSALPGKVPRRPSGRTSGAKAMSVQAGATRTGTTGRGAR
jgi:hypothetical protein